MREIEFDWWHPGRICRIYIGDDISLHDLWVEEVQAMVDQMTFANMEEGYQLPPVRDHVWEGRRTWYATSHRNQPGVILSAFIDVKGEDAEELSWDVCYGGVCVTLSMEEGALLVQKWEEFLLTDPTLKPDVCWAEEGF
ncbi:hypothetical protein Pla110_22370 [Polystyrenella longa]|uniref:Uncharacterized protein n=1 Tax=Polystyrenella longa TaxID=2528007 RepID=A0A518CMQ3_9PLAN|nr:hypothetical protein [Polystyrenella longa]QDU80507.1 hypothetical protein Pla110_22370 [Polystyrenella longa]